MRVCVHARSWDARLQNEFGNQYSVLEMTHAEVFRVIVEYGRAQILTRAGYEIEFPAAPRKEFDFSLEFQNDYD